MLRERSSRAAEPQDAWGDAAAPTAMTPAIARRRADVATGRLQNGRSQLAANTPVDLTVVTPCQAALADAARCLPEGTDRDHVASLLVLDRTFRDFARAVVNQCDHASESATTPPGLNRSDQSS